MKTIFNDGILEAVLYPNQWVFCRWIQNNHGRLQKQLIRDLNDIERYIFKLRLQGWYTLSELAHTEFHNLLKKFGCRPSDVNGELQFFVKPIRGLSDLHEKVVI